MKRLIIPLIRPSIPVSIQRFLSTETNPTSIPVAADQQDENPKQKLIKIAVIGTPNAGKSTFINNLINQRICPTSSKVHTTRTFSKAICNRNNNQMIFFDTPGLVSDREIKKHRLESSFVSSCRHSIQHSNMIAVIHDTSNQFTRNELHRTVLNTLEAYPKLPSFLVLNKVDTLKSKRILLDLADILTNETLSSKQRTYRRRETIKDPEQRQKTERKVGWSYFTDVFMVSSVTGDGLDAVMNFVQRHAIDHDWEHGPDQFTDQQPESLIVASVRARLLDFLPQEIPYHLHSVIEFYQLERGRIRASVQVTCPTERIERLVCGAANGKLRQITERVTSDLVETFQLPVSLTISTRVPKKAK